MLPLASVTSSTRTRKRSACQTSKVAFDWRRRRFHPMSAALEKRYVVLERYLLHLDISVLRGLRCVRWLRLRGFVLHICRLTPVQQVYGHGENERKLHPSLRSTAKQHSDTQGCVRRRAPCVGRQSAAMQHQFPDFLVLPTVSAHPCTTAHSTSIKLTQTKHHSSSTDSGTVASSP